MAAGAAFASCTTNHMFSKWCKLLLFVHGHQLHAVIDSRWHRATRGGKQTLPNLTWHLCCASCAAASALLAAAATLL